MQLRWTQESAEDLERIANYLFEHTPERAEGLVRALYEAPAMLLTFPNRGRPGRKASTRELVMSRLPYIVVYTVPRRSSTLSAYCTGHNGGPDRLRGPASSSAFARGIAGAGWSQR
jgi:toxin ParE1/3/4